MKPHLSLISSLVILAILRPEAAAEAAPGGKKVLLVVQLAAQVPEVVASDAKIKEHLLALGFSVDVVDQLEPATHADGKDLILISSDQEFVYLDPCTGAVLGQRERYGGFLGRIEQLHMLRYREDKERSKITPVCAILFATVLFGTREK